MLPLNTQKGRTPKNADQQQMVKVRVTAADGAYYDIHADAVDVGHKYLIFVAPPVVFNEVCDCCLPCFEPILCHRPMQS